MSATTPPETWKLAATIGLAVTLPCIVYKLTKRITLRKYRKALKSKVVLITGASGGLGEALAHEYQKNGCQLVLCARRLDQLQRVANDLIQINPNSKPFVYQLDVTDLTSLPQHVDEILKQTKSIDVLINNSGILHKGSVHDTENDVFVKVMNVNYFGSVAITKAFLPSMIQRKSGKVVFISSVSGLIAIPYRSAYAASKHAINAFADSLRAEVAAENIQVSVIKPGYIKTDMGRNTIKADGNKTDQVDENIEKGYSAEFIAQTIFNSVAANEKELVICTLGPWIGIMLRKFCPCLYFKLMELLAKWPNF